MQMVKPGEFVHVTPEDIIAAMTPAGAWTRVQLADWGVRWPPRDGWRRALEAGTWIAQEIPAGQFRPTRRSLNKQSNADQRSLGAEW
jgi:hypothetical protein